MTRKFAALLAALAGASAATSALPQGAPAPTRWDAPAAAAYLDARQAWWLTWPNAARDHETACVSCHTALPYALARPALREALAESELPPPERRLLDNVSKRVRMWKDVEPFYPDQKNGLPKSSESRGTEAVLNALILAMRDAELGRSSDDARAAFDNLWALQFRTGELSGAWAWLNFHLEPWESGDGAAFGAALAAIAVGTEPGEYASRAENQDRVTRLRDYLRRTSATTTLFNRVMVLWASARIPGLLPPADRLALLDAVWAAQQPDGGWSLASLGQFRRSDGSSPDTHSDGYATGVIAFALQQGGISASDPRVDRGLTWLVQHQDQSTGMWTTVSLNKQRDPASDVGKFMSDAATAYAVLALTRSHVPARRR